MTNMSKTFKFIGVRREIWNEIEKLRIRDESDSSLIKFLLEFYLDNKPEREEVIYIETKKELKI